MMWQQGDAAALKAPWLQHYGGVPHTLGYHMGGMLEAVEAAAGQYPHNDALYYFGRRTSYTAFLKEVYRTARALRALGVKEGGRVLVCLPNTPQAVFTLYAANGLGAVACMVHPLSAREEIEFYIKDSGSTVAVVLGSLYPTFKAAAQGTALKALVATGVYDCMPLPMRALRRPENVGAELGWKGFLRLGGGGKSPCAPRGASDPAVLLYTGGTTGKSKGALLSNLNLNALGRQIFATNPNAQPGHHMLAALPVFHAFGLGVCVHSMLVNGACSVLVPSFGAAEGNRLLKRARPELMAGVPTMFEALLRTEGGRGPNLAGLCGVYCGGDSLLPELRARVDAYLARHGSAARVHEGYGLTETVGACCLAPFACATPEGSIGVPFPDTHFKIVDPAQNELPYGQEGEICIHGPTVMLGYQGRPEETRAVLRTHADGLCWLHTGDLGRVDESGFVYFTQRIKRIIVVGGYNVYPARVEEALLKSGLVAECCVVGVENAFSGQRVKAFVVPKGGVEPTAATRALLMQGLRGRLAQYALPGEIEFVEALPRTRLGKVALGELQQKQTAPGPKTDIQEGYNA